MIIYQLDNHEPSVYMAVVEFFIFFVLFLISMIVYFKVLWSLERDRVLPWRVISFIFPLCVFVFLPVMSLLDSKVKFDVWGKYISGDIYEIESDVEGVKHTTSGAYLFKDTIQELFFTTNYSVCGGFLTKDGFDFDDSKGCKFNIKYVVIGENVSNKKCAIYVKSNC